MLKEQFAKNLKTIRKSRKLTQEQLAEIVNVDFRYISFLENAKSFPSCDLIEKLSKALNVNYTDLFMNEENMSREQIKKQLLETIELLDNKNLNILLNLAKDLI